MEFITSRGFELYETAEEMASQEWFNIWQRQLFPFQELLEGDVLYWFDRPKQKLVWKSVVSEVERGRFDKKNDILVRYPDWSESSYFQDAGEPGYYLKYRVSSLERLDIAKPDDYRFPQLGWVRVNDDEARLWFARVPFKEALTVEDLLGADGYDWASVLKKLNGKMKNVSPNASQG